MNTKQRTATILILLISLAISSCGSGQQFGPKATSILTPTGPQVGHWKGVTDNKHWSIEFDVSEMGQIVDIGINYYDTFNNPCSFQITNISLKKDNSFDQDISYADIERALGVKGFISGKFINASTFSGKLTISMCGRTVFFYEKDLPWTANWDGTSTAGKPISLPTSVSHNPTAAPTNKTEMYLSQFQPTLIELPFGEYSVGKFAFTSPYSEDPIRKGDPIVVHGIRYSHGIFAHAPSRLVYDIGGIYEQLSATLGLVDVINNGVSCGDGVNFVVRLDGREIYRSNRLDMKSEPVDILLPIAGGYELTLIVEDGGSDNFDCDWAIWGDPRLR